MHYTTLNEIKKHNPCQSGWKKLLVSLDLADDRMSEEDVIEIQGNDTPLSFNYILECNGIEDAVWALRTLSFKDQALFRADVAESVLHIFEDKYPNDKRPREAIKGIRDFHAGKIDEAELERLATAARAANDTTYDVSAAYTAYASSTYASSAYAASAYADNATTGQKWGEIEQIFIKHFCKGE